ncbi:leucyl/phenylalanyl-tRNA--protein transferase [Oleiphilus sp. HI0130]|uniref:leucyl/phenylalanyl-tRNA--protein transferase n=1 Tax=Oleiphilus sp. HI0080 TaxID=1822255 RepID=UPI0007C40A44|nr:leucyl/phenylalanyl-tRNA--protein transferase [Oleiphilus sp. HI0080]KZY60993.1 leucyl/phenylalanyl-tRNA--protein transferase [Oleiphilus sp. HI0065]KZZ06160.1 leucyl/phenylalanyl-tRNA--protein transferase [Oleiphilus sp. HI0073]KZZ51972.1 leucyl/phenylalanyl-tRNA--protein transferase [Oleiphilus sp. HI0122]KZZ64006.1 leucyl/phenylalanyl-tRNA--protein transferase [Oleiphilus sp. HI0130]KZZ78314.1 leucyl/phenylalanyl-tRNA--protein transferase [Oleiphilus sp. HI0133]
MSLLPWLNPEDDFPPAETALSDPNGLLAAGADLSPERLLTAYRNGIFPWSSGDQPLLWWSPDPRCVVFPAKVHISRSLKKAIRKHSYTISFDQCFEEVIEHCARGEEYTGGWITEEMKAAYASLADKGIAHSVEVWRNGNLVGGLYGIGIGCCFFGESMFSLESNASKVAFAALCKQAERWQFPVIDCQIENEHLSSLGAELITRDRFQSLIQTGMKSNNLFTWHFDEDIIEQILAS